VDARKRTASGSLELISQISQPFSSVFLLQQISEQYFQPWLISQANSEQGMQLQASVWTSGR
jgi:hypothetical protein